MPPPLPRSSTVSPGLSSASAVGLPQPSEAFRASSGTPATSSVAYRSPVIGSAVAVPPQHEGSQHEPDVLVTRRACAAYLARTVSRSSSGAIGVDVSGIVSLLNLEIGRAHV